MSNRILVVDDDQSMCDLLVADLGRSGFKVAAVVSADDALDSLSGEEFDAVITDLNMHGTSGIELCRRIKDSRPNTPVVVITAFGSLDTAVAAIRAGAYDFVTKPFDTEQLVLILNRAAQYRNLQEEVRRLRLEVAQVRRFKGLIGESPPMQKVYDLMGRIADSEASVLIRGETGTGKELAARALHLASRRREAAFVPVNCAALPETLLESELFGHVKGAFTDAKSSRKGLFVEADGGTLFLDEIATMSLGLQAKFLRALQDRRIRPVGGETEQAVDVRVVAATNLDLEEAVERKAFREDLLYRINVITVDLPPLRIRGNDVLLLAQHFLEYFARRADKKVVGLSSGAAAQLLAYSWPGNVRELQNCIERAVALTSYEQLTVEDLPDKIRHYQKSQPLIIGDDPSQFLPMEEIEHRYVLRVLEAVGGNKKLAAEILGFDRKTLYRKLERYSPSQRGQ
jgi:two-component system, NtrC family, response regulator AtoC